MTFRDTLKEIFENYPNSVVEKCKGIAAEIISSKGGGDDGKSLVDLVEDLGEKLTSTNVSDRAKGVEILTNVLLNLPKEFLSEREIAFIVDFLIDRVRDDHQVVGKVFHCVNYIIRCKNIHNEDLVRLLRGFFREATVQSHSQQDRHPCFLLFKYLLTSKLELMKGDLRDETVNNFLELCDGEKDPRNLIIMFESAPLIISNFPLGPFLETFFEIFACYFPIDFSPNSQQKGLVTRDELALALHRVLSHTNQFSSYLIPLTMEKLDSSLENAKIDSLALLRICCESSYTFQDLQPHLPTFWHSLRREIFMGSNNEDVEKECFQFISSLFRVLSKDQPTLEKATSIIFDECKHHLSEPELRLIAPTAQILESIASADESSCSLLLSKAIPLIYAQILDPEKSSSGKRKLYGILIMLFENSAHFPDLRLETCIKEWHVILSTQYSFLGHSELDFVILALEFFKRILTSLDFNKDNRDLLQSYFPTLMERLESGEERKSLIGVMVKFAQYHGQELAQNSIQILFEAQAYDIWGAIGFYQPLERHFIPYLFKEINSEKINANSNEAASIIGCLSDIIKGGTTLEEDSAKQAFIDYLRNEDVIKVMINAAKNTTSSDQIGRIGELIRILMRLFKQEEQQRILDTYWDCSATLINPFIDIPPIIIESILGQLKELKPGIDIELIFQRIYESVLKKEQMELELLPYIRLFANLLNKVENESFTKITKNISPKMNESTKCEGGMGEARIKLLFWFVKSIAARGYPSIDEWIEKLIGLLSSSNASDAQNAAESFGILFLDDPISLNKESFCNIMFLYKQKLFVKTVPILLSTYKKAKTEDSGNNTGLNCIRALSSQLAHVPKPIMMMEMSKIFPLLVASLNLNGATTSKEILGSALQTFLDLFEADSLEIFQDYFHDFTPQFLKLTAHQNMDVRILALKCLRKCVKFPEHLVMQVKKQVVLALKVSLDDKKRRVRAEAAKTRNTWILK